MTEPTLAMKRNTVYAIAIFVFSLFVYQSNGDTYLYAYDSAPNSLLVFNAIDNHRLDFDNFRGSYFTTLGASYIFVPARAGKLVSLFPIGAAIVTAPLYAVFDLERRLLHQPLDITKPVFERYRLHYEKQAANIVAAFAAVLMFLCARRMGAALATACIVTVFFAFGTEMWVIGSQALWQHGSVNLMLLAMVYAFLRADKRESPAGYWLTLAGACAGFLPVVRPTAVLFLLASSVFAAVWFRKKSWRFFCGLLVGLMPGLAWNVYFFDNVVGGYLGNTKNYVDSLGFAAHAIVGLLVSPSKGLLVTTPLVVFSFLGFVSAARSRTRASRLMLALGSASVLLIGTYAFYVDWWGGTNFGDRFLSDTAAVSALLLLSYLLAKPLEFRHASRFGKITQGLVLTLLAASIAVQFAGANGEMESEWSAVPNNVDQHPERLWSLSDTQIERDARATYHKFMPNLTLSAAYLQGFDARVEVVDESLHPTRDLAIPASGALVLTTIIENAGRSTLFGYRSGYWIGQSRIRVTIMTTAGAVVLSEFFYLPGIYAAHTTTPVTGTIAVPSVPGRYKMVLDAIVYRVDDPLQAPRQPAIVFLDIAR